MIRFVVRRLATLLPVWLGVIAIAFVAVHLIPGGPFDTGAVRDQAATDLLRERYALDRPLAFQFFQYVGHLLQGDLGQSMVRRGIGVNDILRETAPASALLGTTALVVTVVIGVPVGVLCGVYRDSFIDRILLGVSTIGYTLPSFVLAMFFALVFGAKLGWFPVGGWNTPSHVVLPALSLGLPWAGLLARQTRAALIEVQQQEYVRSAAAKGASASRVLLRHSLRNAVIPLSTVMAILAAELVTGSLVVEQVFGVPGVGHYLVGSVMGSDYTVTLGLITFYATIIFGANLVADLVYALLDPRIRLDL